MIPKATTMSPMAAAGMMSLRGRELDRDLAGVSSCFRPGQGAFGRRERLLDRGEVGDELLGRLIALLLVLLEAAEDERFRPSGICGTSFFGTGGRLALVLVGDAERRLALERRTAPTISKRMTPRA